MAEQRPNVEDIRELNSAMLELVEKKLVYAFPSLDPLNPRFKAGIHCTAEERASAIPLQKLRQIFREEERAFQAPHN